MTCDHSFLSLYLKSYVNHILLTVSFSWSSPSQKTVNLFFTEKNDKGWSNFYDEWKPIIFHQLENKILKKYSNKNCYTVRLYYLKLYDEI